MSKIESYISNLDITNKVTDEEVSEAESLLRLYAPTLRRAGWHLDEMRDACYESRRQSISDFINLAIDYDHDTDRKRIAERLSEIGHNMQLLGIMERALVLVRAEPKYGTMYYDILHARFFDAYCTSNEDAFLRLGISVALNSEDHGRFPKTGVHCMVSGVVVRLTLFVAIKRFKSVQPHSIVWFAPRKNREAQ